jgi:hypothetical protein
MLCSAVFIVRMDWLTLLTNATAKRHCARLERALDYQGDHHCFVRHTVFMPTQMW